MSVTMQTASNSTEISVHLKLNKNIFLSVLCVFECSGGMYFVVIWSVYKKHHWYSFLRFPLVFLDKAVLTIQTEQLLFSLFLHYFIVCLLYIYFCVQKF